MSKTVPFLSFFLVLIAAASVDAVFPVCNF